MFVSRPGAGRFERRRRRRRHSPCRARIARDTRIVRVDSANEAVTLRLSASLEDHSVRLVEVGLAPASADTTAATVVSRRPSFLPGRARDSQDAALEGSLAQLIRRRTVPPDP